MSEHVQPAELITSTPEGNDMGSNVLRGVGSIALGVGASWAISKGMLPGPELAAHHESFNGAIHEAPLATSGLFSWFALKKESIALARAERLERRIEFETSVASELADASDTALSTVPPAPALLPRTRREERRQLKLARKHDKALTKKAEQWSHDRFNIDTDRDLDPATGGYRSGDPVERQVGDMGTPEFVARAHDGTRTPAEVQSMMRQHRRHVVLDEQIAEYEKDLTKRATGSDDKTAKRLKKLERHLDRADKWSRRA